MKAEMIFSLDPWSTEMHFRKMSRNYLCDKTLPLVYLSKKIQPPSQISLQKTQPPPDASPANLRLQGPRHHRPAPASAGAAHRRQNRKIFTDCGFGDLSLTFYKSSREESFMDVLVPWNGMPLPSNNYIELNSLLVHGLV
nr:uncharacterized protein LOC112031498 [Quercus suber]